MLSNGVAGPSRRAEQALPRWPTSLTQKQSKNADTLQLAPCAGRSSWARNGALAVLGLVSLTIVWRTGTNGGATAANRGTTVLNRVPRQAAMLEPPPDVLKLSPPEVLFPRPEGTCKVCEIFRNRKNNNPLTADKCRALLSDPYGKMRKMWTKRGWRLLNNSFHGICRFDFNRYPHGHGCYENWHKNIMFRPVEYFWPEMPVPALLGFDESIYGYCTSKLGVGQEFPVGGNFKDEGGLERNKLLIEVCATAHYNTLRHFGGWNMCVNLAWQSCALRGDLPDQKTRNVKFTIAPKDLDVDHFVNPPQCVPGCWDSFQCREGDCMSFFAVSDVYFTEVCIAAQVCRNREELFRLEYGDDFQCDFDVTKYAEIRKWIFGSR